MKIFFDGYELDRRYVKALSQSAEAFNGTFKLGSTICRAFELEISKECTLLELLQCEDGSLLLTEDGLPLRVEQDMDITTYKPQKIRLTDDMERVYATLRLDDLDTEDDYFLSYKLTDEMVMLNQEFVYDTSQTHTVQELLNMICTSHGMKLATTSLYLADMQILWGLDGMTERDFVSYVAEVNCGYAFINAEGNLEFGTYTNTPSAEIEVKNCSSFKVGYRHVYDRVYLELASATYYYPEESTNDTLYLNPDNILYTSGGKYPYQDVIKHIQAQLNGFNFYNIEVERCPIPQEALCCETVNFTFNGAIFPTIWQVNYDFNFHWYGGVSCILNNSNQEETKIISDGEKSKRTVNALKITVDRELGLIKQEVQATEEKVNKISSDAVFTVDIMYALSSSNTEAPTTGWSTEAPKPKDGEFIWQKTMTVYGDGSIVESTPTCLQGLNGKDGADGKDGINGVNGKDGVSNYIFIRYSANADGSNMTVSPNENTKYIGTVTVTTNVAPTDYSAYSWALIKGADGEKGIPGSNGIDGKTSYLHIKYSNDGSTFTDNNGETLGTWIGTYVDFTEKDSSVFGDYTWKRFVGTDGTDGADGVGIKSIEEQYYLSTSKTELSGGSWQTTCPSWQKGKYIWSRSKITWTDNTVSYTTPTVSSAINDANEKADNTYQTLITYYSTTEQTDSKISQSVSATKTDILGQVSKTYATKASLEIYVTEDKAKNSIASWINACADNIVLNASSKLVFGDLNNQYITISNYSDSSGNKVGVLFDGTGQIMFTPSGAFDVRNIVSGTLKNQFQISALGVSNNVSIWNNQKNNESYYANSVTMGSQLQADGSYNNSINLYNYIVGSNKEANYISMSNDGSSKYLKINNDGTMNRIWFTRTGNNTHIQLANFSTNSGSDIYTNVLEFDSSKGITMLNKDYGYPGNFPRNLVTGFSMRYVDFNINSLDDLRLTASGLLYLNSSDDYVTKIWYNGAKLKKAITISADQIFIKGEGGCYRIVGMTNKCLAVEPVPEGNQSESSGGKYRCQRVYYKEWA